MLSYENNELVVIKVCPRCAKDGRGRGLLVPGGIDCDGCCMKCRLCGWTGYDRHCQEYCFPCEVQQVVVMDLEVLQNLWAFSLRKDESVAITPPTGGYYDALPTYDIRANDCKDRLLMGLTHCSIVFALEILVARGCLLPGYYKITYGENDNG